jgi:hypothetical protein
MYIYTYINHVNRKSMPEPIVSRQNCIRIKPIVLVLTLSRTPAISLLNALHKTRTNSDRKERTAGQKQGQESRQDVCAGRSPDGKSVSSNLRWEKQVGQVMFIVTFPHSFHTVLGRILHSLLFIH